MTFKEYRQRVTDCFKWDWRWGVFRRSMCDMFRALWLAFVGIGAGVLGLLGLAAWPFLVPLSLVWQFVLRPFILALRMSQHAADQIHEHVTKKDYP